MKFSLRWVQAALFETKIIATARTFPQYDVTEDGQKFIINTRLDQSAQPMTIYANWEAEMKGRVSNN